MPAVRRDRLALEDRPGVLVGEDLGPEVREPRRELLVDVGEPLFLIRVQPRAAPHEAARRVRVVRRTWSASSVDAGQRLIDGFDLLEQSRIECDGIRVRSELRLPLAFERLILWGRSRSRAQRRTCARRDRASARFAPSRRSYFRTSAPRDWRRWRRFPFAVPPSAVFERAREELTGVI